MCLDIVLQGTGHCKSVSTILLKRCTYVVLICFGIVLSVRTHSNTGDEFESMHRLLHNLRESIELGRDGNWTQKGFCREKL